MSISWSGSNTDKINRAVKKKASGSDLSKLAASTVDSPATVSYV